MDMYAGFNSLGSLVSGGTHRSAGSPRVSHSENVPVTCTVVVLGLMTKRLQRCTPDDDAVALGAGFSEGTATGVILFEGTATGVILRGHVNCPHFCLEPSPPLWKERKSVGTEGLKER